MSVVIKKQPLFFFFVIKNLNIILPRPKQNSEIIRMVEALVDRHNVSITEISLAWLLTKVTDQVAGATKLHHVEVAAKEVELSLTAEELAYLEEPYVAHVWNTGSQEIK